MSNIIEKSLRDNHEWFFKRNSLNASKKQECNVKITQSKTLRINLENKIFIKTSQPQEFPGAKRLIYSFEQTWSPTHFQ